MLSFSHSVWPFEDSTSNEQENYINRNAQTCSSPPPLHLPFSSPSPHAELVLDHLNIPFAATNGEAKMVKKLNHNASERDRRKKINSLYSTLRSLLPSADQTVILKSCIYKEVGRVSLFFPSVLGSGELEGRHLNWALTELDLVFGLWKKLSIPATVSRVLKYIPELQQQVQILAQEKEELSRINATHGRDDRTQDISKRKGALPNSMPSISTNHLSEGEVAIQICAAKVKTQNTVDFSEILLYLDYHGYPLINASMFESFGGKRTTFCNLHVQVESSCAMDCEALKEKLLALYDQKGREGKFLRQLGNQITM